MDTLGRLTHLKKIIVHSNEENVRNNVMKVIASDQDFRVYGLCMYRDYTGQIRPHYQKSWGKSAFMVFFGIKAREIDYILNAKTRNKILERIDDIISVYSETQLYKEQEQFYG